MRSEAWTGACWKKEVALKVASRSWGNSWKFIGRSFFEECEERRREDVQLPGRLKIPDNSRFWVRKDGIPGSGVPGCERRVA